MPRQMTRPPASPRERARHGVVRHPRLAGARTALVLAAVTAVMVLGPAAAFAQDFVKVEDAGRDQIPAVPFVGLAYGFIWIAILVYVLLLAKRLGGVRSEIQELRRKVDRQGPG